MLSFVCFLCLESLYCSCHRFLYRHHLICNSICIHSYTIISHSSSIFFNERSSLKKTALLSTNSKTCFDEHFLDVFKFVPGKHWKDWYCFGSPKEYLSNKEHFCTISFSPFSENILLFTLSWMMARLRAKRELQRRVNRKQITLKLFV